MKTDTHSTSDDIDHLLAATDALCEAHGKLKAALRLLRSTGGTVRWNERVLYSLGNIIQMAHEIEAVMRAAPLLPDLQEPRCGNPDAS